MNAYGYEVFSRNVNSCIKTFAFSEKTFFHTCWLQLSPGRQALLIKQIKSCLSYVKLTWESVMAARVDVNLGDPVSFLHCCCGSSWMRCTSCSGSHFSVPSGTVCIPHLPLLFLLCCNVPICGIRGNAAMMTRAAGNERCDLLFACRRHEFLKWRWYGVRTGEMPSWYHKNLPAWHEKFFSLDDAGGAGQDLCGICSMSSENQLDNNNHQPLFLYYCTAHNFSHPLIL